MEKKGVKKEEVRLRLELQCGTCGALYDAGKEPFRFCPCCGAGYDRYCIRCRKKVAMYYEEWWPEDNECVRTYSPAKRCPSCNAGLDAALRDESDKESSFEH